MATNLTPLWPPPRNGHYFSGLTRVPKDGMIFAYSQFSKRLLPTVCKFSPFRFSKAVPAAMVRQISAGILWGEP